MDTLQDQMPQDAMDGSKIENGEEKKQEEGVDEQVEGEEQQPVVEKEQAIIQQMDICKLPTTYEDPISFKKAE